MFSSNCSNGLISTSCSFICAPNQSTSRPTSSLNNSYHSFGPNVKLAIEVTTTSDEELRNKKYKEKCNHLQKQIRELVFINKAIHSELNQCLDKLSKTSNERRFLLNKILHFNKDSNQEIISSRILQEALSKRAPKLSAVSPSQTPFPPLITPLPTIGSQTTAPVIDCLSTQSPQSFTKIQSIQSNPSSLSTQSLSTQTNGIQLNPTVIPNKRIKLSEEKSKSVEI